METIKIILIVVAIVVIIMVALVIFIIIKAPKSKRYYPYDETDMHVQNQEHRERSYPEPNGKFKVSKRGMASFAKPLL